MRKLFPVLVVAVPMSAVLPAFADDVKLYKLRLPSGGPRATGVTRIKMKDFPWLSVKRVQSQDDLNHLLKKDVQRADGGYRPVKPAIIYISDQKPTAGLTTTISQLDHVYFYQRDVKDRLDQFRWYWAYVHTTVGALLAKDYDLKERTALIIFETDGTVLHIESPISSPKSVARAMRMIEYKRKMATAVKADVLYLRREFADGNIKAVVKYLQRAERYELYASERTATFLSSVRRAVNEEGEKRIKSAEELATAGERKKALGILQRVKTDFRPLEVASHADQAARRIRRKGS